MITLPLHSNLELPNQSEFIACFELEGISISAARANNASSSEGGRFLPISVEYSTN